MEAGAKGKDERIGRLVGVVAALGGGAHSPPARPCLISGPSGTVKRHRNQIRLFRPRFSAAGRFLTELEASRLLPPPPLAPPPWTRLLSSPLPVPSPAPDGRLLPPPPCSSAVPEPMDAGAAVTPPPPSPLEVVAPPPHPSIPSSGAQPGQVFHGAFSSPLREQFGVAGGQRALAVPLCAPSAAPPLGRSTRHPEPYLTTRLGSVARRSPDACSILDAFIKPNLKKLLLSFLLQSLALRRDCGPLAGALIYLLLCLRDRFVDLPLVTLLPRSCGS
ncbi:proline-rich receptor-like protein kinase PERK2 [Schistocerca piceifrons]|uniref:proline-rich receptor-like protein kinase PERK2 n=1 Tax=Schistocerca piceifrons TaxID=274613 RepID=UPI001F5E9CB5|nr:proline-rich receptor-like protein kinase PERK2 [Schistocerca piceifrons]